MRNVFKRILVPTDFSDTSAAALAYAVTLVEEGGSSLHLLYVLDVIFGEELRALDLVSRLEAVRAIEATAWDELRGMLSREDQARLRVQLGTEQSASAGAGQSAGQSAEQGASRGAGQGAGRGAGRTAQGT